MIKFGVCEWSVGAPGPEAVTGAAELGFAAIHLDSGALGLEWKAETPGQVAAYGEAGAAAGVAIAAIAPGRANELGLTSPAGSENARLLEQSIAVAILAAAQLKAPLLFLPSFANGEIRDEAGLRWTAEALQATCDRAASHGLLVATENTLGLEDNQRLIEMVDRPNFQVLLDTQNPALWGHNVAALTEALWPHLSPQVHVKDGRGGQMGNAVLGTGEAGFAETMAVLHAHDFAGMLISENDYPSALAGKAADDLAALAALFPGDGS